ncbi:Bgt-50316 [Blumeria graminis f. sp. tritici]|uniref:Bgt-50316 n=1 Tax=Blumeria graminis f. sp. tritici TaxID=62690 RepID=A0A9X9MEG5_BLUGR|nr:Bgt-50316 [Blumeria graminis f. sp. tritici]
MQGLLSIQRIVSFPYP